MLDPLAMIVADKTTRRHVTSARPTSPRSADGPGRRPRVEAWRAMTANTLRRLANRVEPRAARTCQPAS